MPWDWHYFPRTDPAIPASVTEPLIARAGLPGTLCNAHASGMPVLHAFGEEHIRTGKPILYTSADSVLQIAAHEAHFGLDRLYETCRIAAEIVHPLRVGRVIARPFVGETAASFVRTANRKDLAIPPPEPTILDRVTAAGGRTHAIGKIGDIFAHRGISTLAKGKDDMALVDATLDGDRRGRATATSSSPTTSTSTPSGATPATSPATPARSRPSTPACPRSPAACATATS